MRKYYVLGLGFLATVAIGWTVLPANDQSPEKVNLNLVDTGWVSHTKTGEGIYMTFQAESLPTGGIFGFEKSIVNICNQFSGAVVPFVLEKSGKQNPENVTITIRYGGMLGIYGKWVVAYKNGKCTE